MRDSGASEHGELRARAGATRLPAALVRGDLRGIVRGRRQDRDREPRARERAPPGGRHRRRGSQGLIAAARCSCAIRRAPPSQDAWEGVGLGGEHGGPPASNRSNARTSEPADRDRVAMAARPVAQRPPRPAGRRPSGGQDARRRDLPVVSKIRLDLVSIQPIFETTPRIPLRSPLYLPEFTK